MFQAASVPAPSGPPDLLRRVSASLPDTQPVALRPAGTDASSWATTLNWSSPDARPVKVSAPWMGATQIVEEPADAVPLDLDDTSRSGQCNQAVFLACYNLAHEMMVRDVGMYAWALPDPKDAHKSMSRIMRRYTQQLQAHSKGQETGVRTVPDPNKNAIQYNLQRARAHAGLEPYVAVIYSAHGILEPPTEAGELWCFDRSFDDCVANGGMPTEYIPTLLFDVLNHAGASTCFIWDCMNAGRLLRSARAEAEDIDSQLRYHIAQDPSLAAGCYPQHSARMIHFAACGPDEALPSPRGMPDDLFTSCLLTPLRIALFFHNLQTVPLTSAQEEMSNQRATTYMLQLWDNMSDSLKSRLWAELRAVVHLMAWENMEAKKHQQLFTQNGDLISAFATGFLLAQRVMLAYGASPESIPPLPPCSGHNLWSHWDLVLETLFEQLPASFEEGIINTSWENGLKQVSFIYDQLESVLNTADSGAAVPAEHEGGTHPGLAKLPIICQAVGLDEFRESACVALAKCLRECGNLTLVKATQSGALHVALYLLDMEQKASIDTLVSIWTSLVRLDACTMQLLAHSNPEGGQGRRRIDVFLGHLTRRLARVVSFSADGILPTDELRLAGLAAILSSILRFLVIESGNDIAQTCLKLAHTMGKLDSTPVKQWGILLAAAAMSRIPYDPSDPSSSLTYFTEEIYLEALVDPVADIRSAAAYALRRQVQRLAPIAVLPPPLKDILPIVKIALRLQERIGIEGSAGVRYEIASALEIALRGMCKWTTFIVFIRILEWAHKAFPEVGDLCRQATLDAANKLGVGKEAKPVLQDLVNVTRTLALLRHDSAARTRAVAVRIIDRRATAIRRYGGDEALAWALFRPPVWPKEVDWDDARTRNIISALERFVEQWNDPGHKHDEVLLEENEDYALFNRSKLILKTNIPEPEVGSADAEPNIEQKALLDQNARDAKESTWILRHRLLEDSLVVAEQQVGLPWGWRVRDIVSPDCWSTVAFHGFLNLMSAVNNSDVYMLYDWAADRKVGEIKLSLAPNAKIVSARFVNELHEQIVSVLEADNGDMIVLSASPENPSALRRVSSWRALEPYFQMQDRGFNQVVASWWRQNGNMIVGGASDVVNVWNCPSERKIRVFDTQSDVHCTTLITEPVSGNLFIAGFADGLVKLYDQRQTRSTPLLSWLGDEADPVLGSSVQSKQGIAKLGVVLGESRNITSACFNGLINIHDLRFLSSATASILVQPDGMSCASFQAHSGIMTTTSGLSPKNQVRWGAYRSTVSSVAVVAEETLSFEEDPMACRAKCKPYSVFHPLRPFLAVGYGKECLLRGAGLGEGHNTDSGSYSFLRAQGKHWHPNE